MRLRRASVRRRAAASVSSFLCCAGVGALACGASYADVSGYCIPANHHFDPRDLGALTLPRLPAGVRKRSRVVDGIRTPLLQTGAAHSSEAVVFLHGNPGSSRDFVRLVGRLTHLSVRVLAFDLPGFGEAERSWSFRYTADGYTRWLTDVLDHLKVRRADLVVHDVGGPLGMQWASEHPARLHSAVMLDSGVLVGYSDHYLARIWKTPELGEQFQATTTRESFEAGIQNGQQKPLPSDFVTRMYAEYDRVTRCAILSTYRSVPDVDAWSRRQAAMLRRRSRPALVIWGAHDPYLPTRLAYAQRDVFPKAAVTVFGDAGHWPFIDDPGETARLVVPFLRRVVRSGSTSSTQGRGIRRSGTTQP